MASRISLYLVSLTFGVTLGAASFPAWGADPAKIARRLAPSVVHITGYMHHPDAEPYVEASGFFVDPDGLVISVSSAFTDQKRRRLCERFKIRLFDGRQVEAKTHAVDALLNLILLSVDAPGIYPVPETDLRRGQPGAEVVAVAGSRMPGNTPFAVGYVKKQHKRSVYGAGLGDILIDIRLDPPAHGDGGPLVNAAGRVVGINTPNIHRPSSMDPPPDEAHALPMRTARAFLKIAKDRPFALEKWIGVAFRPLTPNEKTETAKLLGRRAGLYVDYVWSEGPASRTDIRPGDILVSLNGKDLRDLYRLQRRLTEMQSGQLTELALLRQDRLVFRQVRLEQRPAWAGYVHWRID